MKSASALGREGKPWYGVSYGSKGEVEGVEILCTFVVKEGGVEGVVRRGGGVEGMSDF